MRDLPENAPYARGNEASARAAQAIQHKLTGIRGRVFDYIVSRETAGATGSEIAQALDLLPYTAKPRCSELRDAGYIKDSGLLRKNANNSDETVWVALPDWPTGEWVPPAKHQPAADSDQQTGLQVFDDVLRRNPHLRNAFGVVNIAIIRGDLANVRGDDE